MKHLMTLALGGILSACLLSGDAQACHKKKCGGCTPTVACAPAPCAKPVKVSCAKPAKKCGGGMLAGLGHKKQSCAPAPCTTVVAYNSYAPTYVGAPMASGQSYPTPQATGQSYMPPVPSKR